MTIKMVIFLTSTKEEISNNDYIDKLVANEWHIVSKEELLTC